MRINLKSEHYQQLTELIERNSTGSANHLAKYIGVSRSTLFNMFDEIRGAGVAIEYDDNIRSYTYQNNRCIKVNTPIEVVEQ